MVEIRLSVEYESNPEGGVKKKYILYIRVKPHCITAKVFIDADKQGQVTWGLRKAAARDYPDDNPSGYLPTVVSSVIHWKVVHSTCYQTPQSFQHCDIDAYLRDTESKTTCYR